MAAWAPGGLDYLMDAVGVSTLPSGLDLVRRGGTFVSIPTLNDEDGLVVGTVPVGHAPTDVATCNGLVWVSVQAESVM